MSLELMHAYKYNYRFTEDCYVACIYYNNYSIYYVPYEVMTVVVIAICC